MIQGGEDIFTEFKRQISQRSDFAGEMVAFANTEGGYILVGVDDDGTIAGVDVPQLVERQIIDLARQNCSPPLTPFIDSIETDKGWVSSVHIPRRIGAPHETNTGICYIRVGSTKRRCTPQEHARLLQLGGLVHFDETPIPKTKISDLAPEAFEAYYRRIYEMPLAEAEVPLPQMLENMRFVVRDIQGEARISLAGLLLFGQRPQDTLYYARISAVRWRGREAGESIIDRQEILGRLPEQIEHAVAFIERNTALSTEITDVRQTDRPQYPRPVLREALVNAVAHRDYSLTGAQILLYIFDDRIEIRSPGGLPNGVTLENIRTHYSRARNDTIARVLFNLGYVNSLGSGVPRMMRLMRQHVGREPDFLVTGQSFEGGQFLVRLWGE
jgi:ATP-dependent DNA helicase RecG